MPRYKKPSPNDGRPRKEVDFEQLGVLCEIHCTELEIAYFFDMSVDTLNTRVQETLGITFSELYEQKKGKGKMKLRRKLFDMAMKGSVPVAIFLAKNKLGMSDKNEVAHSGKIDGAPQVIITLPDNGRDKK